MTLLAQGIYCAECGRLMEREPRCYWWRCSGGHRVADEDIYIRVKARKN